MIITYFYYFEHTKFRISDFFQSNTIIFFLFISPNKPLKIKIIQFYIKNIVFSCKNCVKYQFTSKKYCDIMPLMDAIKQTVHTSNGGHYGRIIKRIRKMC